MSVQDKIDSLSASRNTIRNQLINFGLAKSTDKLADLATAFSRMTNRGAVNQTLSASATSYTVPAGYHNGSGAVSITPETKTVTATTSNQTVTPSTGKVLTSVTVKPQAQSATYTYASGDTGGTKDLGATNNYRYVNASNVYNKGKQDGGGVAAVSLTTSSSQLYNKTITVKNSSNTTIATITFNSSGKAFVTIPSAGVYTFTVTY